MNSVNMRARLFRLSLTVVAVVAATGAGWQSLRAQDAFGLRPGAPALTPTTHPALPGHPSLFLLVPDAPASSAGAARGADESATTRFAQGVRLFDKGEYTAALPLVATPGLASTPLAGYGAYYTAMSQKALGRLDDAEATLVALDQRRPVGYLREAVRLERADLAIARGNASGAERLLESIDPGDTVDPEEVLLRLGRTAELAGDTDRALRSYRRVYYEFPLTTQAADAQQGIVRLQGTREVPANLLALELARGETLFGAKRWAQARAGFEPLARLTTDDDQRELIALRIAECDYYLDRSRQAREALRPWLETASRKAEARFFFLQATREIGEMDAYVAQSTRFLTDFPQSSWTEEVLNNLATHYIVSDDDAAAEGAFRELFTRFPRSRHSERAGWKLGWWAYRAGRYGEAAQVFEQAAANFPRADYRPAWLYWAGRAHDQLDERATANARYRLTATDYLNSYYGRLASRLLTERNEPLLTAAVAIEPAAPPTSLIPSDPVVRQFIALELYDNALRELQYAQQAWGDSPAVQATIAWIRNARAQGLASTDRFQNLRGAINQMKRAYPQYLAAGGEQLPPDVLRVIFPLDYWPLIRKYAEEQQLDPYLMAALVAQESTFTADIRSGANAYGLMQLIPSTGRRYATKVGIRPFSTASLTRPETNVRLGMTYFKDLVDRFGGAHFALASYNAGESRVARWIAEKPGIPQDEFIDDIPFPETQNYVKRILGTAEDYRRLYGGGILTPGLEAPPVRAVAAPASRSVSSGKGAKASARTKAPARKPTRRPRATSRPTRTR